VSTFQVQCSWVLDLPAFAIAVGDLVSPVPAVTLAVTSVVPAVAALLAVAHVEADDSGRAVLFKLQNEK
jgi:hypothetical protein